MIQEEQWKPLNNKYEVSDMGRVRHRKHKKILAHTYSTNGYAQVNVGKSTDVHKIVTRVFLGERPEGYEIHHIDNDRKNPSLANLLYLPYRQHKRITRKLKRKPCPVCGKEILATRTTCSSACLYRYTRTESTCLTCGKVFLVSRKYLEFREKDKRYHHAGEYCSRECYAASRRNIPNMHHFKYKVGSQPAQAVAI